MERTAARDRDARYGGDRTHNAGQPIDSITHPIINSPYEQPARYWKLDHEHRATSEQVAGRRPSANLPAVPTQQIGEQLALIQNQLVNDIREAVGTWRAAGYPGATANTKRLLAHWTSPLAMRRLFFAQVEALETLIWLTEIAPGAHSQSDLLPRVERASRDFNDGLLRWPSRGARRRATGMNRDVWYAGGVVGSERVYSDALLIFLLKAHRRSRRSAPMPPEERASSSPGAERLRDIPLADLHPHPANANVMDDAVRATLRRNRPRCAASTPSSCARRRRTAGTTRSSCCSCSRSRC